MTNRARPGSGRLGTLVIVAPRQCNPADIAFTRMEQAYSSIGRAVAAAQRFEMLLVAVFEAFKMISDPAYREKTKGLLPAGALKVPVRNIVKTLSASGNIAPGLEHRMTTDAEDRHLLIHRWMVENGWPSDGDAIGFAPIIELARRVESEANFLTRSLASYMVKYSDPEWAHLNEAEYKERIAKLFHMAHIDIDEPGT